MESDAVEAKCDLNDTRNELPEPDEPEAVSVGDQEQKPLEAFVRFNKDVAEDDENITQGATPADVDTATEVNMEASITADDVMRAGGYGARDDISSFLPVASDSTDFEASLRDARDYEEPQDKVCRHGLGWKEIGE